MKAGRSRIHTHGRRWARGLGVMSLGILLGSIVAEDVGAYSLGEPVVMTKAEKATSDAAVASFGGSSSGGATSLSTQQVFLDFDTGTAGGDHVYTPPQRDAIKALMEGHYADFDFTFAHTVAPAGDFSTITFNAGPSGGLAEHIDFRNLVPDDTATVDLNLFGLAPAEFVPASAVVGSHELGHLVGLRHGDSYGPIGSGIHVPPGAGAYLPAYPGPTMADETTDHVMASPASVGSSIGDLLTPSWFSERSAVKLEFNESGTTVAETGLPHGTPITAQPLVLSPLIVPNTIMPPGDNAGAGPFAAKAVAVTDAAISTLGELDVYSFAGSAGDLFNLEVISAAIGHRIGDVLDSLVEILLPDGMTLVPYYAGTAVNDDEFETFDSIIIDLLLPEDGTYFVRVSDTDFFGPEPVDIGDYELFMYIFEGAALTVPEPGSVALLALGLLGIGAMGRARRRRAAEG